MSTTDHRIVLDPDCRDGKHQACTGMAFDEEVDAWVKCQCPHHLEFKFTPALPVALVHLGGTVAFEGKVWTVAAVAPDGVLLMEGEAQAFVDGIVNDTTPGMWMNWRTLGDVLG